jgi:CheY-like chemotaxis protein
MVRRARVVLVVDDDDPTRELIGFVLKRAGYHVREASTGKAAVAQLGRTRIDVLVVDRNLPGLRGIEVAAQARALQPGMPVVMITAANLSENTRSMVDIFLPKPFKSLQAVENAVRAAFALRGVNELGSA